MGKDLKRWYTPNSNRHIIYSYKGLDIDKYPKLKSRMMEHKKILENRATKQNWWELQQPQMKYVEFMEQEKICYVDIASKPTFSIDSSGAYLANSVYFLPSNSRYLLAILNSTLMKWFVFAISRGYRGGYVTFRNIYVEQVPVKLTNQTLMNSFDSLVNQQIVANKQYRESKAKFIKLVQTNFSINTLPKKLQKFYQGDFKDFVKVLNTATKTVMSLKQQAEWESFFQEYKNLLISLINKISKLDDEIDKKVYELYGISDKEIKEIESSFD